MVKDEFLEEVAGDLVRYEFYNIKNVESFHELKTIIAENINYLITNNFPKLVSVLYGLDISEDKLRNILADNVGKNAGEMIADLIIERQLQKIESRKGFKNKNGKISEDEKW